MADLSDATWSETDGSNNSASPNGWPEGMLPGGVNNSARNDKGALKRFWDRANAIRTVTPSGAAWTYATGEVTYPTAYVNGEVYTFKAGGNSAGSDTFAVNSLGAKPIYTIRATGATALVASDIVTGQRVTVVYDSTLASSTGGFVLTTPFLPIYADGSGGISLINITASVIEVTGVNAQYIFADRDGSSQGWTWYAQSGIARLYNGTNGDRVTIDSAGSMTVDGAIGSGGNLVSGASLFLGLPYILFNGNPNLSQGPYISADSTNFIFRLGAGNGGHYFENSAGTNVAHFGSDGSLTCNGSITAANPINSTGASASIAFADRGGGNTWQWYSTSSAARLWNSTFGDRVQVDSAGNIATFGNFTTGGTVTAGQLTSNAHANIAANLSATTYYITGAIPLANSDGTTTHIFDPTGGVALHLQAADSYYDANSHIFRNNAGSVNQLIISSGNLTTFGNYIFLAGGGGGVNTTGGPLLYGDASNNVYKIGSGNQNHLFQNYAGTNIATLSSAGTLNLLGNLGAGNITGSGTITGGFITSTGNVTASGTVTAAQLTSTGNVNAAGSMAAVSNVTGSYLLSTGHIDAIDYVYAATGLYVNNAGGTPQVTIYSLGAYSYWQIFPGWYWQWNGSGDSNSGDLVWFANNTDFLHIRISDGKVINSLGPFAGLGAYIDLSDRRGKENVSPTTVGLAEIRQLSPMEFDRKVMQGGAGSVPSGIEMQSSASASLGGAIEPAVKSMKEIGFVAQDVALIMPEAVKVVGMALPDGTGGLEDPEPSLGLTLTPIVVALVNAVKELATRLEALETV